MKTLSIALGLTICAGLQAATLNTNLSVQATGSIGGTSITATGTATLTAIGSGTFSATVSLSPDSTGNFNAPFTITLTTGDKINGTIKVPASVLSGSGTGSATISGGTGAYAGATGSFPSLAGTGSLGASGLSLSFNGAGTITTGGVTGGGGATPTITSVQDAASNTPNIAQGSLFIVKGANLSASGYTPYAPPRPTNPNGVKVTFTPLTGGAGTDCYIFYLYNQSGVNQIGAILPSTVTPGTYNVTVTSGGSTSAPTLASVVANKVALFTQDQTGSGLAALQNYISASRVDLNRLTTGSVSGTTISPAHPGQAVIAYGTGLGPYAAGDNTASPAFDFRTSLTIQAVVGGVTIPVDYAGRAGFAGEDQINFTLPANVPTGCAVSLQISVNGRLSPPATISIAPNTTADACVIPGYTTAQLQNLDQGGSIVTGAFAISQFSINVPQFGTGKSNSIGGSFLQLTAFNLSSGASAQNPTLIQTGSCIVTTATSGGTGGAGGAANLLDAGTVTVSGPGGSSLSNQVLTKTNNSYGITNFEGISIPGQINFALVPGTYTVNGQGGPDVGSFNASVTLSSPVTVTGNLPTTVNRSTPLTINWTGGNPQDLLEIIGGSSVSSGTGANITVTSTTFICITTAGAQTFTVPVSILSQLPATTGNNIGSLAVGSGNTNSTFSAPLPKIGGSVNGIFATFVGAGSQVTWQ